MDERGLLRPAGARRGADLVAFGTALAVVGLAGIWIAAAAVWPRLPERIPVHFGADGTPDRFADRSAGSWCELPAVVTGLAAFFLGIERLVLHLARRRPGWLNVPRKRDFLALPEEARVRAVRPMIALTRGFVAPVAWIFTFIVWATYVTAWGGRVGGATFAAGTFGGIAASLVWVAVCTVLFSRAVRRETERAAPGREG